MTGDRKKEPAGRSEGFTLLEVLIALAMAALGFGVILHSVGMQMSLVANSLNRHQMLLYASQVLETNLSKGLVEEEVTEAEISSDFEDDEGGQEATEIMSRFIYSLESNPVTADPRVQQVTAALQGPNKMGLRLSAYRLRVQRE